MRSSDWFHRDNKSFLKAFATFSVFFSLRRNLLIIDMLYCAIVSSLLALGLNKHLLFPFSYPTSYWFQLYSMKEDTVHNLVYLVVSRVTFFFGIFFFNHLHFPCHFELSIMHPKLYICRLSLNQFFKRK